MTSGRVSRGRSVVAGSVASRPGRRKDVFGGRRPVVATGTGSGKAVPGRRSFVPWPGSIVRGVAGEPVARARSGIASSSGGFVRRVGLASVGDFKPRLEAGARGSGVGPASMRTGSRRASGPPVAATGGGVAVGVAAFGGAMGAVLFSAVFVGWADSVVFAGAGFGLGGTSAVRSVAVASGFFSGLAVAAELRPCPPRREEKLNHDELSSLPVGVRQPTKTKEPAASSHRVHCPRRLSMRAYCARICIAVTKGGPAFGSKRAEIVNLASRPVGTVFSTRTSWAPGRLSSPRAPRMRSMRES